MSDQSNRENGGRNDGHTEVLPPSALPKPRTAATQASSDESGASPVAVAVATGVAGAAMGAIGVGALAAGGVAIAHRMGAFDGSSEPAEALPPTVIEKVVVQRVQDHKLDDGSAEPKPEENGRVLYQVKDDDSAPRGHHHSSAHAHHESAGAGDSSDAAAAVATGADTNATASGNAAPAASEAATDLNFDGRPDAVGIDVNHDGTADAVAVDADHDGRLDGVPVDTDGDGQADALALDMNHDGTADAYAAADGTAAIIDPATAAVVVAVPTGIDPAVSATAGVIEGEPILITGTVPGTATDPLAASVAEGSAVAIDDAGAADPAVGGTGPMSDGAASADPVATAGSIDGSDGAIAHADGTVASPATDLDGTDVDLADATGSASGTNLDGSDALDGVAAASLDGAHDASLDHSLDGTSLDGDYGGELSSSFDQGVDTSDTQHGLDADPSVSTLDAHGGADVPHTDDLFGPIGTEHHDLAGDSTSGFDSHDAAALGTDNATTDGHDHFASLDVAPDGDGGINADLNIDPAALDFAGGSGGIDHA